MDRLDALRLFVRVVETASFSKAALELGFSQPVASRAIASLEAHWRSRLIHRTTRNLTLTEAGQRAYERAVAVLAESDTLESTMLMVDHQPVGLLRLSASAAFSRAELVPSIRPFLTAYPHMRVDLQIRDDRVDLVSDAIDMAFRFGDLPETGLMAQSLGIYARWLVAAPEVIDAQGLPLSPKSLAQFPTIGLHATQFGRSWPMRSQGQTETVEIQAKVSVTSGDLARELAIAGNGVALLPSFAVAEALANGTLVRILPEWSGPPLELHAIWLARQLTRKSRAYLDFVLPTLRFTRA